MKAYFALALLVGLAAVATCKPVPGNYSIKYEINGKCMSRGPVSTAPGARHAKFSLLLEDCDQASSWMEGHAEGYALNWPVIKTVGQASVGIREACVASTGNGKCLAGVAVDAVQCEDEIKPTNVVGDQFFWDDEWKQIRSVMCYGMCLDMDQETGKLVLNDCPQAGEWKRHGGATPKAVFHPSPLPDAAKTGRYHMFWPFTTYKGLAVVGIDEDGYPSYFGSNNAEICPDGRKYGCEEGQCKCLWPNRVDVPLWHGGKHNGKTPAKVSTPIKRSDILERAITWVAHGFAADGPRNRNVTYGIEGCSQDDPRTNCPQYFHGGACCSLPTMAWNVSSGNCLRGHSESIRVDCKTEMKPGDAVSLEKSGKDTGSNFPGGKHIVLFKNWVDEKKTHMMVYEHKGKNRVSMYGYHENNMYCMKRKNIIEDCPLNVE